MFSPPHRADPDMSAVASLAGDHREPIAASMVEVLSSVSAEHASRSAVVTATGTLTYGELDALTDRCADYLLAAGVLPGHVVAIDLPLGMAAVVAVVASLKTGAAFLPLGVDWPASRTQGVLRDSAAQVLISDRTDLADLGRGPLLPLSADLHEIRHHARGRRAAPDRHDPAYVLYTSGSSGQPKGVVVEHRNILNYLAWAHEKYGLVAGATAVLHSPLSFDLSLTSLLGPLTSGGTVLIPAGSGRSVASLARLVSERPVDLLKLTPTHCLILAEMLTGRLGNARRLVIGGEALHSTHLRRWHATSPDTVIFNEYGPTETTVGCCVHRVTAGDVSPGPVPIGRPIFNTQLDLRGTGGRSRTASASASGEIVISGQGVARGYHRAPAEPESRFVGPANHRSYRSGDLAQLTREGDLVFLGRLDDQVKWNGYRIEPGEIEAAALDCEWVGQAVAFLHRSPHAGAGLALAVTARTAEATTAQLRELRAHLTRTLPAHMRPRWIRALPAVDATGHGKLDRRGAASRFGAV